MDFRSSMTVPLTDQKLKVTDLLGRPGSSRRLELVLPPPSDFDARLAQLPDTVELRGVLESVVDGLLLRGELHASLHLACARCLTDVDVDTAVEVVELFGDPVTASETVEEGYEIIDDHIDLDTLLRDALAEAVPYQTLCDQACRGLCASCGANLNEVDCDCADDDTDPRWAVLEKLQLPERH